jgi:hypothetical protein
MFKLMVDDPRLKYKHLHHIDAFTLKCRRWRPAFAEAPALSKASGGGNFAQV